MQEEAYRSFIELWKGLVKKQPDSLVFRVASPGQTRSLNFRTTAFFKRISRVAAVFRSELGLPVGSRVLLFQNDPEDMPLLLHGLWYGGLVPVPLKAGLDIGMVTELANACNAQAVVFPTAASAQVAQLFSSVPSAKHWLLSGASSSNPMVPGIQKLDELMTAVTGDEVNLSEEEAELAEALILLHVNHDGDRKAAVFSQKALLESAHSCASLYPETVPEDSETDEKSSLLWSGISVSRLEGLLHSFIAPLYRGMPVLVRDMPDIRKFWEQLRADSVTFAVIDQEQLRVLVRRGKSRAWGPMPWLSVLLHSQTRLSYALLENFETKFEVPICPCFSCLEAGGVVSGFLQVGKKMREERQSVMRHRGMSPEEIEEAGEQSPWGYQYSVPSAGACLNNSQMRIVDVDGKELESEQSGRIVVNSSYRMSSYLKGFEGGVEFLKDGSFETGDEGFYLIDSLGNEQIFVTGRKKDFVQRGDERVNLARVENVLSELRGVEYALAVGFPNEHVGWEVGAYVIGLAAADLKEYEVSALSRRELSWFESPKVIIVGKREMLRQRPGRENVADLFAPYRRNSYVRPGENS